MWRKVSDHDDDYDDDDDDDGGDDGGLSTQVGYKVKNGTADSQRNTILAASLKKNLALLHLESNTSLFWGKPLATSVYENQPTLTNLELILGSWSCDSNRPHLV